LGLLALQEQFRLIIIGRDCVVSLSEDSYVDAWARETHAVAEIAATSKTAK